MKAWMVVNTGPFGGPIEQGHDCHLCVYLDKREAERMAGNEPSWIGSLLGANYEVQECEITFVHRESPK